MVSLANHYDLALATFIYSLEKRNVPKSTFILANILLIKVKDTLLNPARPLKVNRFIIESIIRQYLSCDEL